MEFAKALGIQELLSLGTLSFRNFPDDPLKESSRCARPTGFPNPRRRGDRFSVGLHDPTVDFFRGQDNVRTTGNRSIPMPRAKPLHSRATTKTIIRIAGVTHAHIGL